MIWIFKSKFWNANYSTQIRSKKQPTEIKCFKILSSLSFNLIIHTPL